ncbi:MAG: GntR family transcriptional regulator [Lachnospiraceae bacterium]|nr:GntR family transcriptional regulator [Lachnospiraceae bacterium]
MENKAYLNVVQYIKNEIQQDRLRVGNKLPTEREMSAQLGFSRNSIREALRTLSSLGIIESRQGSGNYLSGDVSGFFTESFEMMALVNQVKPLDISQMRRALEIQAFSQIIDSIGAEHIESLRETLRLLSLSKEDEQYRIDLHFHLQLIELSGNTLMTCTSQALSNSFQDNVADNLRQLPSDQKLLTMKAHNDIVSALASHDLKSGIDAINIHYDIVDNRIRESGL